MSINERIKELRLKSNLSRKNLSTILGVSENTVRYWEEGRNLPGIDCIIDLCKFFNVTSDYLLGITDQLKDVNTDYHTFSMFQSLLKLDKHGQQIVRSIIDLELNRIKEENPHRPIAKSIQESSTEYLPAFTVRYISENKLSTDGYSEQLIPIHNGMPAGADFALEVVNDPFLDETIIYLKKGMDTNKCDEVFLADENTIHHGLYTKVEGGIVLKNPNNKKHQDIFISDEMLSSMNVLGTKIA